MSRCCSSHLRCSPHSRPTLLSPQRARKVSLNRSFGSVFSFRRFLITPHSRGSPKVLEGAKCLQMRQVSQRQRACRAKGQGPSAKGQSCSTVLNGRPSALVKHPRAAHQAALRSIGRDHQLGGDLLVQGAAGQSSTLALLAMVIVGTPTLSNVLGNEPMKTAPIPAEPIRLERHLCTTEP